MSIEFLGEEALHLKFHLFNFVMISKTTIILLSIYLISVFEAVEFQRRISVNGVLLIANYLLNSAKAMPLLNNENFVFLKKRSRRNLEKNLENFQHLKMQNSEIDKNLEFIFNELDKNINSFGQKRRWHEIAIVSFFSIFFF